MLVRTAEPVSGKVFNSSTSCAAGDIDPHPDEFTFGASVELSGTARSVTNKNTRDLALLSEADETKLKNSILQYHRFVAAKALCIPTTKYTAQITELESLPLIYCRHYSPICPARLQQELCRTHTPKTFWIWNMLGVGLLIVNSSVRPQSELFAHRSLTRLRNNF